MSIIAQWRVSCYLLY